MAENILTSRKAFIRFEFDRMDKVWKQGTIIDEERRQVIPYKIVIAAFAVNFGGETMRISADFTTSSRSNYDAEPHEDVG